MTPISLAPALTYLVSVLANSFLLDSSFPLMSPSYSNLTCQKVIFSSNQLSISICLFLSVNPHSQAPTFRILSNYSLWPLVVRHQIVMISNLYCLLSLPLLPLQMLVTHVSMLSHVQLFAAPMDCKPPGSSVHRILQQEYWSGLPFASPGDLPDPGIKPTSPVSLALADGFSTTEPPGKPPVDWIKHTQRHTIYNLTVPMHESEVQTWYTWIFCSSSLWAEKVSARVVILIWSSTNIKCRSVV